jgi:transcriptional regulator of acetoin/glycerol metabolism
MSTSADWTLVRSHSAASTLSRAVDAELDGRLAPLSRLGLMAILVDPAALVLARWGFPSGTKHLRRVSSDLLPPLGASMAEGSIGTHAANMALESGAPEEVVGHEHLHERYLETHSVAVPIVNPATERALGALVIESVAPGGAMLLPWACEVTEAVRLRIQHESSEPEMLLMADFVAARATSRRPVICLDQQTLVSNAAAARLLGSDHQALLWEYARRFLEGEAPDSTVVELNGAGSHTARFERIAGCDGPAGVRITLQAYAKRTAPAAPRSTLVRSLPGQSRRWARFVEDLESALSASDRVVLVGEPGTGKRHVARALVPATAVEVDCSSEVDTLEMLRSRHFDPRPLVVTHLERLPDAALAEVEQILRGSQHPEAPVVFTLADDRAAAAPLAPRGSGVAPWVRVPTLRDRLDDLPQLVAELTATRTETGQAKVRWMPDALQVLARVDWPENLRSLQSVVDAVNQRCSTGYVNSQQLPEAVRAQAAGRRLSRLEQLEASEMLAVLREADGNKLVAAQRLGIARSTLYRRLRSLGLDLSAVNY